RPGWSVRTGGLRTFGEATEHRVRASRQPGRTRAGRHHADDGVAATAAPGYEPELVPSELLTELNVPLMLVPRFLTIVTQATTIRASITAYSTAVGPSSLTRKR